LSISPRSLRPLRLNRAQGWHHPWPRLWHNLRASCESDLAQQFPIGTVTRWLGNTTQIAMRHYVDPTEEAYRRAASFSFPASEHTDTNEHNNINCTEV